MPRIGKNSSDRSVPAADDRRRRDFEGLVSDPHSWGEPLSYVDLLTDPSVQSRVARLIVQSALRRPRRG